MLLATLPGSVERSAAGFGDRDAWCWMFGVLAVAIYLWKEQIPYNPPVTEDEGGTTPEKMGKWISNWRRYLATALAGFIVFLGGLSWESFGLFVLIILCAELWKFCTTETEDEITNETFLKAFNERETIKYPDKLVSWLYKTAKHAAIDRLRARQRDVHQMPDLVFLDNLDAEREAATVSIFAAQQAQQIETQIETDQYLLTSLLRLLTEKDREVVEYLLDGLKPKQIAEVIDSTAEAVQKRWERILKWLSPIAHRLDELLNNLPSQERKIMERYLDNQPLEYISEKLSISPTDVETCVKRVIKQWKKTTKQNAAKSTATKLDGESN